MFLITKVDKNTNKVTITGRNDTLREAVANMQTLLPTDTDNFMRVGDNRLVYCFERESFTTFKHRISCVFEIIEFT